MSSRTSEDSETSIGTGFASIDAALGGLIAGDNVVWICDDSEIYDALSAGLARTVDAADERLLHVSFGGENQDGPSTGTDRLDAGPHGPLSRPTALADELDRRCRSERPDCIVMDDLAGPLRRWGLDTTVQFFARVCPSMLHAGVTAYWRVGSEFGRPALESIRQITQCFVDVRNGHMSVLKSEGRTMGDQGSTHLLTLTSADLVATLAPAGGRLARGLATLRRDLGLTQQELAEVGGVTASAISQAESGARRLSIDTLMRISDRLGIPIDRMVNAAIAPTYRLARHDRSRRLDDDTVALAPDNTVGARVFLVELPGRETRTPSHQHRGVEVLAAICGLVQIDLGHDRPVLRPGDALILDDDDAISWRNLRDDPAAFFRILRD